MGIILCYGAFPAIFTALLLQAVLFHFGGLVVLGANCFSMAFPALFVYLAFGKLIKDTEKKSRVIIFSFIAGFIAVIMAASVIGTIPPLIVFLLFQKHIVKGMLISGIK